MRLLHARVDTTVIALRLGHEQVETPQMYLHADLALKERALARTKPLDSKPGRYRPPDALLVICLVAVLWLSCGGAAGRPRKIRLPAASAASTAITAQ